MSICLVSSCQGLIRTICPRPCDVPTRVSGSKPSSWNRDVYPQPWSRLFIGAAKVPAQIDTIFLRWAFKTQAPNWGQDMKRVMALQQTWIARALVTICYVFLQSSSTKLTCDETWGVWEWLGLRVTRMLAKFTAKLVSDKTDCVTNSQVPELHDFCCVSSVFKFN